MPSLTEVFGLSADPRYAYVDRGSLDDTLRRILETKVHAVIHGGSKQGKTWLRERVLDSSKVVTVQCQPNSTVASLLQEVLGMLGVRAALLYTSERTLTGEIDLSLSAELGIKVLAKAKTEAGLTLGGGLSSAAESAPIGRTPGDLAWVALILRESGKRVVLEDFHYLSVEVQRDFAFVLKGFHGYDVFFLLMGVWAQTDLLTYYNGDLDGRVEEIRLEWSDDELLDVIHQGARHLNVRFSEDVCRGLVSTSYRNVGLLERLAEQVVAAAGIDRRTIHRREIDDVAAVAVARQEVADRMRGRYANFAQEIAGAGAAYRDVMRAIVTVPNQSLVEGIPLQEMRAAILQSGGKDISKNNLRAKLSAIADVQGKIQVTPPILAWDLATSRLFVVEQTFLFYRTFGSPTWPWED